MIIGSFDGNLKINRQAFQPYIVCFNPIIRSKKQRIYNEKCEVGRFHCSPVYYSQKRGQVITKFNIIVCIAYCFEKQKLF